MTLHIHIGPGLEPVPRCKPSTYLPNITYTHVMMYINSVTLASGKGTNLNIQYHKTELYGHPFTYCGM